MEEKHSPKHPCQCKRKCATKFTEAWRESLCNNFWRKCETERNEEVKRLVKEKKQGSKLREKSRRNRIFIYELENEKYEKTTVCKHFFLTTLGLEKSNDRILACVFSNSSENNNVKHSPKPPCDCKRNCRDKIPEVTREKICDYYWSLSEESERRKLLKKYAKPKINWDKVLKRNPNKDYKLPISKNESITVCKHMFLTTFGHGPKADRAVSWILDPPPQNHYDSTSSSTTNSTNSTSSNL